MDKEEKLGAYIKSFAEKANKHWKNYQELENKGLRESASKEHDLFWLNKHIAQDLSRKPPKKDIEITENHLDLTKRLKLIK